MARLAVAILPSAVIAMLTRRNGRLEVLVLGIEFKSVLGAHGKFSAQYSRLCTGISRNEHCITVAEEAIARADGCGVGGQNQIASPGVVGRSEGADEHQERRAGQVKVGQERVRDFEVVGGMDENA